MKRFRLCLVLLILCASITSVPARSEVTISGFRTMQVYWGTDQPKEVSPGDTETLTVVMRYELSCYFTSLGADLSLPGGFKAVGGGSKVTAYYTAPVTLGSIVKLSFPVSISPDVTKGSYKADLRLEYIYVTGLVKEELEITFEVTGKPHVDVKVLNETSYEGRQRIVIALSNDGDAIAENLEIVRVCSTAASVELEDAKSLGDFEPGGNVTVPLNLFVPTDMRNQVLPLSVEASCLGPSKVAYLFSETLQLAVKPSDLVQPLRLSLEPRELSTGKSRKVYVELENTGSHSLSDMKLTFTPDSTLRILGSTVSRVESIGPGDSVRIEVEVHVPSTTIASTASLTVAVTCFDEGLWLSQSETYLFTMFLKPADLMPKLALDLIPSEVDTGKTSSVYIELQNVGDHGLSEVRLNFAPDSVLRILGSAVFYVERLGSGESKRVETEIYVSSSTVASTASLTVAVSYFDEGLWLSQSETRVLGLLLKPTNPMPPLVFSLVPAEVSIGKSSRVYIDLTNAGDRDVSEIQLALTPDTVLKVFGPTVFYVDRLSPGESRRMEAEVYVPSTTAAPTASLTLAATYIDEDFLTSKTESHVLSVLLRGLIEISLTDVAVIPSTPRSGSPFSVTITVTNIGTSPAYAASAFPSLEGLPSRTFGSKSVYIGNIETNLPTTFTINLQMLNTTEKSIALPIVLSYMDNLRSLHNVTFRIPIEVASQPASPLPGPSGSIPFLGSLNVGLALGVAAAVTVAAVVVWKRRKK